MRCNKSLRLTWTRADVINGQRLKLQGAPVHLKGWNVTFNSWIWGYFRLFSICRNKDIFLDTILHSPDHRTKTLAVWHNPFQVWGNHCLYDPIIREWDFVKNKWKHNFLSVLIKLCLIIQCGVLSFLNMPQVHWQIFRGTVRAFLTSFQFLYEIVKPTQKYYFPKKSFIYRYSKVKQNDLWQGKHCVEAPVGPWLSLTVTADYTEFFV